MKASLIWSLMFLALLLIASYVCRKARNYGLLVLAFCLSLSVPVVRVVHDCHVSRTSEACTWGQSLLPIMLPLAAFVGGPILYLLLTAALAGLRRWRAGSSGPTEGPGREG